MRAVTALGTIAVAGAVLTVSWQAGQRAATASPGGIHVVSGAGASGPGAPGAGAPGAGSPKAPAAKPGSHTARPGARQPGASSAAPPAHRSVTGALVQTPYGTVQVRVSLTGHRITNVTAVHLTDSSSTSVDISANAAPVLRREALRAQSAHIDVVSGATYTSDGYRTSLQAALDAAFA